MGLGGNLGCDGKLTTDGEELRKWNPLQPDNRSLVVRPFLPRYTLHNDVHFFRPMTEEHPPVLRVHSLPCRRDVFCLVEAFLHGSMKRTDPPSPGPGSGHSVAVGHAKIGHPVEGIARQLDLNS
jgi:hypothetical protein